MRTDGTGVSSTLPGSMDFKDGSKLQTGHTINGTTTTTDYVGNMIYENGKLERTLVNAGYIENDEYYFYIQYHLGNNRVVVKENGTVV